MVLPAAMLQGEPSSSATWSILTSSRSDVGDSDAEAPAALPHPANYPVLTMIECAKLYFDAVKIPPHFFSPPPGHDKLLVIYWEPWTQDTPVFIYTYINIIEY